MAASRSEQRSLVSHDSVSGVQMTAIPSNASATTATTTDVSSGPHAAGTAHAATPEAGAISQRFTATSIDGAEGPAAAAATDATDVAEVVVHMAQASAKDTIGMGDKKKRKSISGIRPRLSVSVSHNQRKNSQQVSPSNSRASRASDDVSVERRLSYLGIPFCCNPNQSFLQPPFAAFSLLTKVFFCTIVFSGIDLGEDPALPRRMSEAADRDSIVVD